MTQVDPRPAATEACAAERHGSSNEAWRKGCRCRDAMAAHDDWLRRRRMRNVDRLAPPAVDATGACLATQHDTVRAYQRNGCRCAAAVAAWKQDRDRRALARRKGRNRELAELALLDSMRVRRRTGGRLTADPRKPWRGGRMAVGRVNLWMLIHGFKDKPTMGERIAAVALLSQTYAQVAWFETPRLMTSSDIAARLDIAEGTAYRLIKKRRELAEQRAQRRLADRRWKDAYTQASAGRAERERERHAAAQESRRARRLFYARTARRLARARERAAQLTGSVAAQP